MATNICTCTTWESEVTLRQCPEHFHIWKGATRLYSVGRIIRTCWPQGKLPPQHILENARERGDEVDKLAAAYVRGELKEIPAGTRTDSRDLFFKFQRWFDKQGFKKVEAQVLLGDTDHGGIVDFIFDGIPYDLKSKYEVTPNDFFQVAGYSRIISNGPGRIIQVTERKTDAYIVPILKQDSDDWLIMLEHWRMLKRRGQIKGDDNE